MKKEKELSHKGDKPIKHKKDRNIDVLATNVEPVNSRSDDSKYEYRKKRCGPCVICNENHTYKRKFGDKLWPTDRLFNCQKFKNMNKK